MWGNLIDDPDFLEIQTEEALENGEDATLSKEQAKEEKGMKAEIAELWQQIQESGSKTLGEYLANRPFQERKRARRTERKMYQEELSLIWQKQSEYHDIAKDEHFKKEIETLLFKQRPLKLAADRLGRCSLERQRPRARKAWPNVQRFRYWQDLNNLTYVNRATSEYVELSLEDKQTLAKTLERQKTLSWAAIRKKLGLDKIVHFNLEESKKHLTGCLTACTIRNIIGEKWDALSDQKQNQLAEDLITINDKKALKNRLVKYWKLETKQAIKLSTVDLEQDIANHSTKAINKLLPYLQQGLELSKARVEAGYDYEQEETDGLDKLGLPPHIPNPIVSRALHETRKVINAIIHHHGKPDAIRIEMAREMKMTKKQKEKYQKQQNSNEKANKRAEEQYLIIRNKNPHLKLSQYPSKTDLIKYRLREEADGVSVYSGKPISLTQLFSAEIEIDHILPFSRTLNDSFANKVVCFEGENKEKANRTPYEAWGETDRYDDIKQAIRSIRNKSKRDAFYVKELKNDEFLNSQINDTRYISREILHYVKQLYDTKIAHKAVSVSKGNFTAWLRHEWGLNTIISPNDVKDRSDHRHHLIDAIVIALVSRSLYQDISKKAKYKGDRSSMKLNLGTPWNGFKQEVESLLKKIIISHAPRRRIADALHEDFCYAIFKNKNNKGKLSVSRRKPLDEKFTESFITKNVIDDALKEKLLEHLTDYDGDPKIAFKEQDFFFSELQAPVRHVRVITAQNFNDNTYLNIKDSSDKTIKLYKYGNAHHIEAFYNNHDISIEFVTAWQAITNIRKRSLYEKQSINGKNKRMRKNNPTYLTNDDKKPFLVLTQNDMVKLKFDGVNKIFRVKKISPSRKTITLQPHLDATDKKENEIEEKVEKLLSNYKMKKIKIQILGQYTYDQTDS